MSEVIIAKEIDPAKRSDFLTGLCLFSIIGSGWFLLCAIVQFLKADEQTEAIAKEIRDILATDEFQRSVASGIAPKMGMQMAERMAEVFTVQNLQIISITGMVGSLLCLSGIYFIWQLKKTGFYLYLAGVVIPVVVLLILFGVTRVFTMGMLALNGIITLFYKLLGGNSYFALFFTFAAILVWCFFIMAYWRQSKKMKQ